MPLRLEGDKQTAIEINAATLNNSNELKLSAWPRPTWRLEWLRSCRDANEGSNAPCQSLARRSATPMRMIDWRLCSSIRHASYIRPAAPYPPSPPCRPQAPSNPASTVCIIRGAQILRLMESLAGGENSVPCAVPLGASWVPWLS